MSTFEQRARVAHRTLQEQFGAIGLAEVTQRAPILDRLESPICLLERAVLELVTNLQAGQAAPSIHLDGTERAESLAIALVAVAKKLGPTPVPIDSLHSHVVNSAPDQDKHFWSRIYPQQLHGLLRYDASVQAALSRAHVLVREYQETGSWRVVYSEGALAAPPAEQLLETSLGNPVQTSTRAKPRREPSR